MVPSTVCLHISDEPSCSRMRHSTRPRPQLLHERLASSLLEDLDYALAADLTGMSWREHATIRGLLVSSEVLQAAAGAVAPRERWREARDRVEAQMRSLEGDKPGRRMRPARPSR